MPEVLVLVTGVSAGESREKDREFLRTFYPEARVELFDPEKYMPRGRFAPVFNRFNWMSRAHDVLAYAGSLRREIDRHFQNLIRKVNPDLLVAHSLGTVIAGRNLSLGLVCAPRVLFLNSPLWMPLYSQIMGFGQSCHWPNTACVYSSRDWISRKPLRADKFTVARQVDALTSHDFNENWLAARQAWPEFL